LINKGKKVLEGNLSDIKLDFSRNVISLGFSGDISALENHPEVEEVRSFGQDISITIKEGADTDSILRTAIDNGKVDRFEIGEMSLHDIFIAKVKEEGSEVEDETIKNS
jgi:ABC-2 type transport system ATP-binding protein